MGLMDDFGMANSYTSESGVPDVAERELLPDVSRHDGIGTRRLLVQPQASPEPGKQTNDIHVLLARGPEQMRHVCDLVNRCYASRGYRSSADPLVPFPDLERSAYYIALLAVRGGKPVGTVTVGIDSMKGLLVDEVNRPEVDAVRRQQRGVCELVRLAIDDPANSKSICTALFEKLYELLGLSLRSLSDLFIEVNPRHAPFYVRLFGFRMVATKRTCARVGAPSVLLRLTREELQRRLFDAGRINLGSWPSQLGSGAEVE